MYKVIGSRASRGLRVLWMLEELGQPYEHVPAKPRSDEARSYGYGRACSRPVQLLPWRGAPRLFRRLRLLF